MPGPHETPRVSVIIPCYNGERFVVDAVESVLAQTEPRVEAIVVDDCSSDSSVELLEPLLSDSRLRILRHSGNRGIAAARNTGIRASEAEFVGLLDQDDLWLPEKIALQLAAFDDGPSDLGLVFSPVETRALGGGAPGVMQGVQPPERLNEMSVTATLRALYEANFITTASVLLRRSCFDELGMLNEAIRGGSDDYEFWLRLAARYPIRSVGRVTAVRRLHDSNVSSDRQRIIGGTLGFIEQFGSDHEELADLVEPKLAWLHARLGGSYRNDGRYSEAQAAYRESLGHAFSWRTVLLLAMTGLGPLGGLLFGARRKRVAGG